MEAKNLWIRIIIDAYKSIPVVTELLGFYIDRLAYRSFRRGIAGAFEEIAEKLERKEKLLNLKYLADKAVEALDRDESLIVRGRMNRKSFENISEDFGMSMRSLFRRHEEALKSMAYYLTAKGFDEAWFMSYFKDEAYICRFMRRYGLKAKPAPPPL